MACGTEANMDPRESAMVPRDPPKLGLKKIALARPCASKISQDGSQVGPPKPQFWKPKLASIWGGSWSPRAPQSNFLEAQVAPPTGAPSEKKIWPPGKESLLKSDFFFWGGAVLGGQLRPPKKLLCGALGLQDPSQMEANLGLQS